MFTHRNDTSYSKTPAKLFCCFFYSPPFNEVGINSTKALIISLRLTSQQPIIQPLLREIQTLGSFHERNLVLINQLVYRGDGKAQHLRCFIDR